MMVRMQKAKYETLTYFDADGSHDERDIPDGLTSSFKS